MWKTYLRRVPQFILTAPSCKPVFHSGTQYHSEFRSITKFPNPASKHCYDSDGRYAHSLSMTMSSPIKAALIDLSGTLHIEDIATQGAQDALCSLLSAGIKVKFVTNTTKEPLRLLHLRLQDMQFTIKIEDMFTSLTAARSVVEERCLRPFLMLEEGAKEDFKGVLTDDPNAVVIGLSPSNFNYPEMNHAFGCYLRGKCVREQSQSEQPYNVWLLLSPPGTIGSAGYVGGCKYIVAMMFAVADFNTNAKSNPALPPDEETCRTACRLNYLDIWLLIKGASLIAIHKGRYYKKKDGLHIGPGPFVEALQVATGADAVVVGKPEKDFFHQALKTLSVDASEAVMIGDDVQDDVGGAQDSGIRGMLVQTGKYRKGDENTIQPEPFQSCQNFAEAVNYILKYNSNFNS